MTGHRFKLNENQIKDNQLHSSAKPDTLTKANKSIVPDGVPNGSDTGRTLDNKKDEAKKSIKYNKNNNLI